MILLILLWILQQRLSLLNELPDNGPLGLQLIDGLLLSLDQLLHVLHATGRDLPRWAQHDAVKELDVRRKLVAVRVAAPVQVNLNRYWFSQIRNNLIFIWKLFQYGIIFGLFQ